MSPWYAQARAALGASLFLSGDIAGAAGPLGEAVLSETAAPMTRMFALSVAAMVSADQGQVSQAEELAAAAHRVMDASRLGSTPQGSLAWLAAAVVHIGSGKLGEARSELERALRLRRAWRGISPWATVEILLRLAEVLLALGERSGAGEWLAEASALLVSAPDGARALQTRLTRLERRLRGGASPGAAVVEPLTEREETVLRLLRGTLSVREIGSELGVSGNTIKTHTRSIYRKLGVTTRRDAVEWARESGVLP